MKLIGRRVRGVLILPLATWSKNDRLYVMLQHDRATPKPPPTPSWRRYYLQRMPYAFVLSFVYTVCFCGYSSETLGGTSPFTCNFTQFLRLTSATRSCTCPQHPPRVLIPQHKNLHLVNLSAACISLHQVAY